MMKLFSTKTHGVLDYLTVGQLLALPRMLGWSEGVTQWMSGMALGTLTYSLMTRYELGLLKLLPMKGHLTFDFLNGMMFCAAPLIFPEEDSTVKGALVGIGLFEIMASLTTESEPSMIERMSEQRDSVTQSVSSAVETPSERTVGA